MGGPIQAKTPNIDALAERGCFYQRTLSGNLLHAITHRSAHRYEPVQRWSLFKIDWRESDVFSSAPTLRYLGITVIKRWEQEDLPRTSYYLKGAQGQQDTSAWDAYFPSLKRQLMRSTL